MNKGTIMNSVSEKIIKMRKIQCRMVLYTQKKKGLIEKCGWKEWEHR